MTAKLHNIPGQRLMRDRSYRSGEEYKAEQEGEFGRETWQFHRIRFRTGWNLSEDPAYVAKPSRYACSPCSLNFMRGRITWVVARPDSRKASRMAYVAR
jgi:hypothetical protein